ncbi:GH3 family domain-containing protein [Marinoscillum furvescens]|uniref:GH3 auxin-responsive promoter n=1 Tax=Marinoscillum furvescens DSM 4134 TaxID=1122208 RepID=A0A3D9L0I0_MARFU|nr:GH3 auxin-responsive promoter family protein [Marinoscillum furvescens]RED94906.1 GH3 auxin-responsive promoter [Marinoscillum furvescens DSM 4134]
MAFVGSLVKAGISLNQKLNFDLKKPEEHQRDQLVKLLEAARKTAFGKFYGFRELLKSEDVIAAFQREVPIHDYDQMHDRWWRQQLKYPDITWPGKPQFYARSSGTTGKTSKRIPITDEFLQSIRDVGTSLVRTLPNFDFPKELFETEILMLSSSANLDEQEGHYEGEISGINVSNFPGWYDWFYRPGKEIASIDNWDERIARIVQEAPHWNIGGIAGIPSWVLIMLQEVVKAHRLKNIHELWPNLTVYASGGVAYDTYREGFEKICGKPIQVIDTYLASEGFFAYSARPDTMTMELALSHGYFYEFIPFDERGVDAQGNLLDQPEVHTLADVEQGQEYVLLVSSCAGAWRYMIGDTIKFTSIDPHEIKITGRTKFFLNVVGSQLSEEKMDTAIVEVAEQCQCEINEYAVAAVKEASGYVHQWVIVCEQEVDESHFANLLDQSLAGANKNYAVARSKALEGVKVMRITKQCYHDYLERTKKKGGQVKTPKVMPEEKMRAFLSYANSWS